MQQLQIDKTVLYAKEGIYIGDVEAEINSVEFEANEEKPEITDSKSNVQDETIESKNDDTNQ
ncbi:MAG: hypothetical protein GX906_04775 [Clostridiales bacterium]|nr:hypothetical protein [Clostridiales bacterium]